MTRPSYRLKEAKKGRKRKMKPSEEFDESAPTGGGRKEFLFLWVYHRMISLKNGYRAILKPSIAIFDRHPLHFLAAFKDLCFGKSNCSICNMQG
jgi:hypothetical protein